MVSVIIASYNPAWKKMKATILSVLYQEDVEFEVIIADDGSENDFTDEIIETFNKFQFNNYKILKSKKIMEHALIIIML